MNSARPDVLPYGHQVLFEEIPKSSRRLFGLLAEAGALALAQAGLDESSRRRAEGLVRLWKVRNKVMRPVAADEAKALRMVVRWLQGEEHG